MAAGPGPVPAWASTAAALEVLPVSVADLAIGDPEAPEVDPEEAQAQAYDLADDLDAGADVPMVDEAVVRGLLAAAGGLVAMAAAPEEAPEVWTFTERELDDLTPPVTRIVNRRPQLRRAVMHGDEVAVAMVLAGYVGRNAADLSAVRALREEVGDDGDEQREDPGLNG